MSKNYSLLLALITGFGLGLLFFYGLWRTIKKVTTSELSVPWFVVSMMLRLGMTMVGFYLVVSLSANDQIKKLLLCLLGFMMVRFILTKVINVQSKSSVLKREVSRES